MIRTVPPAAGPTRATPLHLRATAVVAVMGGGVFGAAARDAVEQALPTAKHGFPTATFVINLAGAFLLGLMLEALVRSGDDVGWRRTARLVGGTGFCGAFTTYSTLAVETVQLARDGSWPTGVGYLVASVVGGLLAVLLGIALGAGHSRGRTEELPVDPDVDQAGPLG